MLELGQHSSGGGLINKALTHGEDSEGGLITFPKTIEGHTIS